MLVNMQRDAHSWLKIQENLAAELGFILAYSEPRITAVMQALLLCPDDARRAEDWAREVGLSSSRFQYLFKQSVGNSFRRYRL